ncbi:hypothetical protein CMO83_02000 [Candidatus Woesearchaeota archaeon]|jgi:CPA2 family monovalent cation:H+ antiporter-2|nr:hypothetical protein [Candidatus Woesearchaeota archaeon]MDP6648163.1 cation:proton antiporter [Candidatus Woesearchaeota archaeon]|tara:strand:- start:110265 stop:112046 length:1782 start_codon:yes stop_codon:yes gene_type:complete
MAFNIELLIILLFSIVGGVLAVRFKQPSVLGLIIVGAIVGPNALGLISDTSLINAAIEIGAVLLLFTIGIEFSLKRLFNLGLRSIVIAVLKLGLVFLLSYYTALLFGFGFVTALFIGVIISITSTVIFLKILDQKGFAGRDEIPLLIAILIIEDIFGIFALTFFSSLKANGVLEPLNILTSLLISLVILLVAYLVLLRILKPIINWLIKYRTEDTFTFVSLGLLGIMTYIAIVLKLSPSVGAFLAGNIVASLPEAKNFEKSIHPFILTFTALFFFSIGTIVDFSVIFSSIFLILALFIVNILSKFFTIGFGSYLFSNYTGKQAVFAGVAMLSVGEFSLLIAKEAGSLAGIDLVSITAGIILLSSFAMSVSIANYKKIHSSLDAIIPAKLVKSVKYTSNFLNSISLSMVTNKVNARRIAQEWKTILNNIFSLFIILTAGFFIWNLYSEILVEFLKSRFILNIIIFLTAIAIFLPALNIVRNVKHLLGDILTFFTRLSPKEKLSERKIFTSFIFIIVFFLFLLIFPGISLLIRINPVFHIVVPILILGILIHAFRCSSLIQNIIKKRGQVINNFSKRYKLLFKKQLKQQNSTRLR